MKKQGFPHHVSYLLQFQVLVCVSAEERHCRGATNLLREHRVYARRVCASGGDGRFRQRGVPRGRVYTTVRLVLRRGELCCRVYCAWFCDVVSCVVECTAPGSATW